MSSAARRMARRGVKRESTRKIRAEELKERVDLANAVTASETAWCRVSDYNKLRAGEREPNARELVAQLNAVDDAVVIASRYPEAVRAAIELNRRFPSDRPDKVVDLRRRSAP